MSRTDEELLDMEVWVQLATLSVHLQWPIEGFLLTLQVHIQMEILHTCRNQPLEVEKMQLQLRDT